MLGLPVIAVIGLALLALPRAVLHDLSLIQPETFVNFALVVVPVLAWIAVAVTWSSRPLISLLAAGIGYGIGLAIVHNLFFTVLLPAGLEVGTLDGAGVDVVGRIAATLSSLATGTLVGVVAGLVAWGLQVLLRRAGVAVPRR